MQGLAAFPAQLGAIKSLILILLCQGKFRLKLRENFIPERVVSPEQGWSPHPWKDLKRSLDVTLGGMDSCWLWQC